MTQVISNTGHDDMIHDVQFDFYGRRIASCSSDKTIKIFDVDGETQRLTETLRGHDGAVWSVAWAHPKFGTILASASYDGRVLIWRSTPHPPAGPQQHPTGAGAFQKVFESTLHAASVNALAWAPPECGCVLACASADGAVSVLEFANDAWEHVVLADAHALGVNGVSWAPAGRPGGLASGAGQGRGEGATRRFVSGGSDCLVKVWDWSPEQKTYTATHTLTGHGDWVRDVAWSPSVLGARWLIASASQDKTVRVWTADAHADGGGAWTAAATLDFPAVVWRASWSPTGNVLAVSQGDNKVSLWKENLGGKWECARVVEE